MKDEKARYLIIDSNEIKKQLYNVKREFAFNDWDNVYIPNKIIDAKEIFDKYNIPEEFQKIIIKVNIPFFIKTEAYEYIFGYPFDITAGKIEMDNNQKYITVANSQIFSNGHVFRDKIKFKTRLNYFNFDGVNEFLQNVESNGYLELYLQSIIDFFDESLDLEEVLEIWNKEKNSPKSLVLYRKKI